MDDCLGFSRCCGDMGILALLDSMLCCDGACDDERREFSRSGKEALRGWP